MPTNEELALLWNYGVFPIKQSLPHSRQVFIPSVVDYHGFLREMKMIQDIVDK